LEAAAAVRIPYRNHLTTHPSHIVCFLAHSYPETFKVCLSAADVEAATTSHPPKIASLIGMEGGHSIGGSIDTLTAMYRFQSHFTSFRNSIGFVALFLLPD
jgi:hypothetical protein